ncbi:MAG: SprT-like domain-containing protein [Propionibacteriaceae bacterium]|jgi:predicted SprT family Zn-dependent metalloprotease|nr:SprT-like domain-containing protein [Propionibacteriaceae bacterium]
MPTMAWTRQRAAELIDHYLPGWTFAFDHARTRIGCCHYHDQRITLSRHLLRHLSAEEVDQALRHEIAHALTGPKAGHGAIWRRTATGLGYTGQRTMPVPAARQQARWIAACPQGHTYLRHRRPSGTAYCGPCSQRGDWYQLDWEDQRLASANSSSL